MALRVKCSYFKISPSPQMWSRGLYLWLMARFQNVLLLAVCTGGVYFSGQGLMEVIYQGDREEKKETAKSRADVGLQLSAELWDCF